MSCSAPTEFAAAAADLVRRELTRREPDTRETDWQTLWQATAAAGWFDTLLPEEHGGLGLGLDTAVELFTLIGRCLIPGPYLDHLVAAPTIYPCLPASARARLDRARAGAELIVLADPAAASAADELVLSGSTLNGHVGLVRFGAAAAAFLVLIQDRDRDSVALVDASSSGVTVSTRPSFDPTSVVADVGFAGVTVPDDAIVSTAIGGAVTSLLERLRARARLCIAAELAGVSRHLVDATTAYALDRTQFGRPIGSFAPVQHTLARMATETTGIEAFVADSASHAEPDPGDAVLVKGLAAQIARRVGEASLQVHGGIAFTREFHDNRWFLRALTLQGTYGDEVANFAAAGRRLLAASSRTHGEDAL